MDIIGFNGYSRSGKDTAAFHLTTGRGYTRFAFGDEIRDHLLELDPFMDGTTSVSALAAQYGSLEAAAADRVHGQEITRLRSTFQEVHQEVFGIPATDEQIIAWDPLLGGTKTLAEIVSGYDNDWDKVKSDRVFGTESRRTMQRYGTEAIREHVAIDIWITILKQRIVESGVTGPVVITDVRENHEAAWIAGEGGSVLEITRPGVGPVNGHKSESGIDRRYISATIANDSTRTALALKLDAQLGLGSFDMPAAA